MSKRRSRGEGTIYPDKKHSGRFTAQITLPDGHRKARRGTQKECREWLLKQRNALKNNTYVLDDSATVANLAERYLRDVAPMSVGEITLIKYRAIINKHIIPELGSKKLSALRAEHLQALYSKKLKGDLENGIEPLKPRTVADIHIRFYTMLKQARKWGYVSHNVAEDATPPKFGKDEMNIWTRDEVLRFLESIRSDRLYPIYAVAISMGLRRGEVLGLRWEDVDFVNRRLWVKRQLQYIPQKGNITKQPKTKSAVRNLPMQQITYDALIELREKSMGTGFVFVTSKGTPFNGRNVDRDFKNQIAKAGLPEIRFHDLRHGCASYHLAIGTNPKVVQQLLGHSRVEITLQTYSHVLAGVTEEAVSKLDDFFTVRSVS